MTSNQIVDRRFRSQMGAAMETVRKILELTRTPRFAADEDHTYDDKFGLAEFVVNSAIAAQINALERMGLEQDKLQKIVNLVHKEQRSVTLRFAVEETCEFLFEREVEIESPSRLSTQVTESTTESTGGSPKLTEKSYEHKVITKVKEYHWKVGVEYKLFCFAGSDSEKDQVVLQSRESSTIIITTGNKHEPISGGRSPRPIDVSLTWFLQNLSADNLVCTFGIDRSNEDTCRTPRRNDEVNAALESFDEIKQWSRQCRAYFCHVEGDVLGRHKPAGSNPPLLETRVSYLKSDGLFAPVLPLMESPQEDGSQGRDEAVTTGSSIVSMKSRTDSNASPLLSIGDVNRFLQEQCRSLDEATGSLADAHPSGDEYDKLISVTEAKFVLLCVHLADIAEQTRASVDYIEQMLRDQLVAAIGKEVQSKDFEEFRRFHNQKLLGPGYAPKPFCYAIRRPNHYPDGIVSIEVNDEQDTDKLEPIESIVRKMSGNTAASMVFPINAATSVEFTGERYLHAWIQHRFASSPRDQPKLIARARQFSSFLLMVGTISGPDKFDPKDAIILQNKDEVIIPLLFNELPTPKEFKDAISSLSPEQQRFAKSFRGMQLESSVFGVCVVQLKPQLEKLLGLPLDALTKEIGLTQDLLSLFIEYQIPSDLLSFDGPSDAPVSTKVEAVKGYVKKVQDVIAKAKTKQLEEETQKADMREEMTYGAGEFELCGAPLGDIAKTQQLQQQHALLRNKMGPFGSAPRPTSGGALPPSFRATAYSSPMALERGTANLMAEPEQAMIVDAECSTKFDSATDDKPRDKLLNRPISQSFEMADSSSNKADFTAIPKMLNAAFDKHDGDNALRTTIIKTDKNWTRLRQENLLTKVVKKKLGNDEQKSEKNKAFDLLDALSRSGALPIACAELHVVLGVTHCFENTVMNTVIMDNINPIEKMDKSTLLIASTIHGVSANDLLKDVTSAESAHLLVDQPSSVALPVSLQEAREE